ncbi:MAG TPA: hypothetical protein VGP79_11530 [Bryobacteraceae bacterium]|jgi:hypothetical protein|nr:hypothetical protein [Bryobacteraceae bacterium]
MPFQTITPRPFTTTAIQIYAPAAAGVYGITNAREWIFIGESDNIQGALLDHLRNSGTSLMQHQPAGFVYETCVGEQRKTRQGRLVTEYTPICNLAATGRENSYR